MPKIGDTIPAPANLSNEKRVTRLYEVTLAPKADWDYDPMTVALSYTEVEAAKLDPTSRKAAAEAAKRAIKLERRDHHTPANRTLLVSAVSFKGESLKRTRKGR